MARNAYAVTGAVAVVQMDDGASRYLYKGSTLPEGVTNIDHLKAVGLIAEVEQAAEAEREGSPSQDATDEVVAQAIVQTADDLAKLDLNELRALAAERGVDQAGRTKKADIVEALIASTEPAGV